MSTLMDADRKDTQYRLGGLFIFYVTIPSQIGNGIIVWLADISLKKVHKVSYNSIITYQTKHFAILKLSG